MPPHIHNILSNLRKNVDYIKHLTLSANHAPGTDFPFADLLEALHLNETLQQVKCQEAYLAHLTATEFEALLEALATLPRLRELTILLPTNRSHLSSLVVTKCVAHPKAKFALHKLVVSGFDRQAVVELTQWLMNPEAQGTTKELVELQLLRGSAVDTCASTIHTTAPRSSSRSRNRNQGSSTTTNDDNNASAAPPPMLSVTQLLARALRKQQQQQVLSFSSTDNTHSNKFLQRLSLSCWSLSNADIVAMVIALRMNTILQYLDLRCCGSGGRQGDAATSGRPSVDYTPLLRVLQHHHNGSLLELKTDAPSQVQLAVNFYTQLNAVGVTHFLRHKTATSIKVMDRVAAQQQENVVVAVQQRRFSQQEWMQVLTNALSFSQPQSETKKKKTTSPASSGSPRCAADKTTSGSTKEHDSLSLVYHLLREDPSFLLSYSPLHDKDRSAKSLCIVLQKDSQNKSQEPGRTTTIQKNVPAAAIKYRRKPVQGPVSFLHLNLPW